MKPNRSESGEVMLEGMIVMVITMIMLIFLLGLGFIYYQRYVVTSITNDAAIKIADTYAYPMSDLVIGYVEPDEFTSRNLYRAILTRIGGDSMHDNNEAKITAYIERQLEKTNFSGVIKDVQVTMEVVTDSTLRSHIEVETVCEFNTPFGFALEFLGLNRTFTYKTYGRADCTDKMEYISTSDYFYRVLSASDVKSKTLKMANSITKFIYKIIEVTTHDFD